MIAKRLVWCSFVLAAAWLPVASCGTAASPGTGVTADTSGVDRAVPDSLRDQVVAALEQYYADFSARDWQRFAEHFWPGATLTTIWQPPADSAPRVVVTTVPEFVEQAPLGPGSKPIFEERMTGAQVRAVGSLAQVWASYTARFGEPGNVQEWTGIDAFTLMRHGGRWRIVSLAYAGGGT